MRVIYIDPQSYSNTGLYDYSLLKNNSEHNIIFLGNSLYSCKSIDSVDFKPIFFYSKYKYSIIKLLSYCLSLLKSIYFILKFKPNIIHIEWIRVWVVDYYWLRLIALISNAKIVYKAHNVLPHDSGNKYVSRYNKYYHFVDIIICHTNISKDEIINRFGIAEEKITVIPHGIFDFNSGDSDSYKQLIKNKYSLDGQLVFSSLGEQSLYKGSDIIADVWSKTPELHDVSKYRLLIVGKNSKIDFSNINNIENVYIENRFILEEEFSAVLELSDVILLPYRTISQSGVLFSAIGCSIPVIVSNVGGLPEPLKVAEIGWNIGDPTFENLQNTLLSIARNSQVVYKKKQNLIEWNKVKSFYSWDNISKQTFELYKNII